MNTQKKIILFDGVCNFCSFWVNFVIKRDKKDVFRFASLQSEIAKELAGKYNVSVSKLDTFILIVNDRYFTKSTAALMVSRELNSAVRFLYLFIILPKFLRDFVYDLIARYRYKIFGKRDVCYIPTDGNSKFLD